MRERFYLVEITQDNVKKIYRVKATSKDVALKEYVTYHPFMTEHIPGDNPDSVNVYPDR
jgi:hypothetical protein